MPLPSCAAACDPSARRASVIAQGPHGLGLLGGLGAEGGGN
jgi:hypothetical protein